MRMTGGMDGRCEREQKGGKVVDHLCMFGGYSGLYEAVCEL